MFQKIIAFSLQNKLMVLFGTLAIALWGAWSVQHIPLDAVPDITNNQVQVVTSSPSLAAQEVEQFITYPLEIALANVPGVDHIRSVSKFGLSVITVVFEEHIPTLQARQLVGEQLTIARADIPTELGDPEMMPITTGLGEIFQYTLDVEPAFRNQYNAMDLRTIQDWIVKRQFSGIPGVVEVSSFGGFLKQYEIAADAQRLAAHGLTLQDLLDHLERNNANSGGGYVEEGPQAIYIRTEGRLRELEDLRRIPLPSVNNLPLTVGDVAEVRYGSAVRYGAMTENGQGEAVGGITLMLKGANSSEVISRVEERVAQVQKSLPEGVYLNPYLNRSELVGRTISTVTTNLIEGGLIVIFVLVLLLGNLRAGLVVASVIPLAMLFALGLMKTFGVSANLMSLGAIDFGIVVDGAVIVVEGALHLLHTRFSGRTLTQGEMDDAINESAGKLYKSAAFGVLIILLVFLPILTLTGVEGKMFVPMAQTVSFALLGAFLLSLTYVPVMSSLAFNKKQSTKATFADKLMGKLQGVYLPSLLFALKHRKMVVLASALALVAGIWGFTRLGAEFIPQLEEGDLAMQLSLKPGSSLAESVRMTTEAEKILLREFPEVKRVVSKIGTAEVPTDPMSVEDADVMILMKPKKEWTTSQDREELMGLMKESLSGLPILSAEFTQPIQLRFNELLTGSKSDISVKIFGDDTEVLARLGEDAAALIQEIEGAGDVKLEQTEGLPQWVVKLDRERAQFYGVDAEQVNKVIQAAYAGLAAGNVYEGQKRFEAVVRLRPEDRATLSTDRLFVRTDRGELIPLSAVTTATRTAGPSQVSREDTRRRIGIGINVRERDLESLVQDIQQTLEAKLDLPPGYTLVYGGDFENLQRARGRLMVLLPLVLVLILFLLYLAFNSVAQSLLVFSAIPLSALGGIAALALRGMPFSISAGVGFIALFGVAVLNGIVLVSSINQMRQEGDMHLRDLLLQACSARLRPVIMTAAVAALGFLPMAISTGAGAEVQKPLATVVIGGLITSTFLTLIVLPVLYQMFMNTKRLGSAGVVAMLLALPMTSQAQQENRWWTLVEQQHPEVVMNRLQAAAERAEVISKWDLGPTTVQYQYGQMNASNRDRYWSVSQSLGSLPAHWKRGAWLELKAEAAQEESRIAIRKLRLAFGQDYHHWRYCLARLSFLEGMRKDWQNQLSRWEQAFKQGELNRSEWSLAQGRLLDLEQQLRNAKAQTEQAGLQLKQWLGTAELELPEGEWEVIVPALAGDAKLLVADELRVEAGSARLAQHQLSWFPELELGYFNQQLEGVPGFTGWWAGISIPLFTAASNAAQVKRSRLEMQQAASELEASKRNLERDRQSALVRWQAARELLPQMKDLQSNALLLQADAARQLEAGEINVLEYSQWLEQANALYEQALRTQLEHNWSAEQLNFYYESK